MTKIDLRKHYQDYISAINEGCKLGTLHTYVHEGLIHNGSPPLSVADYTKIITDSQASFPNLRFNIDMLIVEPDQDKEDQGCGNVAARIKLAFNPKPDKEEVFYEHVFYRFEKCMIRQVWSMLDGAGLRWALERKAMAGQ